MGVSQQLPVRWRIFKWTKTTSLPLSYSLKKRHKNSYTMTFWCSCWDHWGRMQYFLICQGNFTIIAQILQRRDVIWLAAHSPTRLLIWLQPQMNFQKLVSKWVSQSSAETFRGQRMMRRKSLMCRQTKKRKAKDTITHWIIYIFWNSNPFAVQVTDAENGPPLFLLK